MIEQVYLQKRISELPNDVKLVALKPKHEAYKEGFHYIPAKASWQQFLWGLYRLVAGAAFLFLFVWMWGQISRNKWLLILLLLLPAFLLLLRGAQKLKAWRMGNNVFLLFTNEYLMYRTGEVVSMTPWESISRVEIGLPNQKLLRDQVPFVTVSTTEGDIGIVTSYVKNIIDEPANPIWQTVLPGVVMFATSDASLEENEFAIRKRVEEYVERYG